MATKEDAALIMQILQWSASSGATDAYVRLMATDFDPASASAGDRDVFVMLLTGETIGTFTKQGLLDEALVNDLWAASLMWQRVGPAALRQREEFGVPALWENFEALAGGDPHRAP